MEQTAIDLGRRAEAALGALGWAHLDHLTRVRVDGGTKHTRIKDRVHVLKVDAPHVQGILCAKIVGTVPNGVTFDAFVDGVSGMWMIKDRSGCLVKGGYFDSKVADDLLYSAALVDALEWLVEIGAGR